MIQREASLQWIVAPAEQRPPNTQDDTIVKIDK